MIKWRSTWINSSYLHLSHSLSLLTSVSFSFHPLGSCSQLVSSNTAHDSMWSSVIVCALLHSTRRPHEHFMLHEESEREKNPMRLRIDHNIILRICLNVLFCVVHTSPCTICHALMHEWYIKLCHLMVVVGDVHEFLCHQTKIYLVGGKKIFILKYWKRTYDSWNNLTK